MSEQENIRIVQEGYAAFAKGEITPALKSYADDVDWAMPGSPDVIPYVGRRRGIEQVTQFYVTFSQIEEVEQMELQDFLSRETGLSVWTLPTTGKIDWTQVHEGLCSCCNSA